MSILSGEVFEQRGALDASHVGLVRVYLKEVSRIQALLGAYFFALLVQTLLERELRQAMRRGEVPSKRTIHVFIASPDIFVFFKHATG